MLPLLVALAVLASGQPHGRLLAPVGVVRADDQFSELLPAGTRLPATATEVFVPSDGGQRNFQLSLVQETKFGLEQVTDLILQDLPRASRKKIVITFRVDASRALWVTAHVKGTRARRYGPFQLT